MDREEINERKYKLKNNHGAVGRLSSEQQFRISDRITFIVLNFWSRTPSRTRSYGRLADEIQVIFEIFKIHYRSK